MRSGQWYDCLTPAYESLRAAARAACHAHGTLPPEARGSMAPELRSLFAEVGAGVFIEAPFHCSYGVNVSLGPGVYLNAGCTLLDSAMITIGGGTMCGPGVQIYTADHHRDAARRAQGIERGLPVVIGRNVWIGGGAIVLPGVTIGEGAIIGAGSVVTRDVESGARVAGNPERAIGGSASQ